MLGIFGCLRNVRGGLNLGGWAGGFRGWVEGVWVLDGYVAGFRILEECAGSLRDLV